MYIGGKTYRQRLRRHAPKEERMRKHMVAIVVILVLGTFMLVAGGDKEASQTPLASESREFSAGDRWSFSWRFLEQEVEFTVSAPTTGWVAIGFNPSRMMKDAHYILGYVSEGKLYLRDDFGTGNTSHASDASLGGSDDVRPVSGSEENGVTTITFAVPRDAQDAYDIDFIQGETYKVLLAYGGANADNYTGMHRARQSLDVILD